MKITHDELMALSPAERDAVIGKMAHPARAGKPRREGSVFAPLLHFVSNLLHLGRAAR